MVRQLYTDTRRFLDEAMVFYRLRKPVYVVTLIGLVNMLQTIATVQRVGDMYIAMEGGLFVLGAVHFLQPFALWLAVTAAVWVIGKVLGAHARFGHLLKGIGWGMVPLIGAGVLWALARYLALAGSEPPLPAGSAVIGQMMALREWLNTDAVGEPVYVGLTVAGFLFVLASAYLWTIALDEASDFGIRKSAITVAVPVVVYLWWMASKVV